ncbi:MAG: hypothetical protein ACD_49C00077G0020 [uncultured bacterium (gcode 4)]|uniref:HD/PDEase domain-containing protein n=1 Tax=uncultured bacterium (gcode 4) TaxID=1234023 RepID=K2AVI0_9BACT|nr:MAG: hypothetical protein ACD_49C00077G0020 [uncultured bacterium (gcode 4)]
MYKLITQDYLPFLDIFSEEKPEFLLPFFESKTMQRLSDISQNCGTEYCRFFEYTFNESRLEHSLWVALIIWHFTKDKKQTLAGFFHDISNTVFSHVGDYLLWDKENQESSEQYTTKLITEDEVIMRELKKLGITVAEVEDYKIYTIADNPGPQLSSDRLEYTLSSGSRLWNMELVELKEMYDDLEIFTNEKQEQEIGFKTKELWEKFWLLSLQNDSGCFSSYESASSMSFLSEILAYMLKQKMIKPMDLYTLTDSLIISIMESNADSKLSEMWNFYKNLSSYKIEKIKPKTNKYFVTSKVKRRFIDPLIQTNTWPKRLSELSPIFVDKRDYHLSQREEWVRLDYEI